MSTKRIRAIVVEDEPNSQKALVKLIEQHCPDVKVVSAVFSVGELLNELDRKEVDLLFLDVNLGKESAFDALEKIQEHELQVVFTTAHKNYAVKAFEYRAVHYLLKPIITEELIEAIARVKTRNYSFNEDAVQLFKKMPNPRQRIALPDVNGFEMVTENEIIRLEGEGAYTHVFLRTGEQKILSRSIGYFESMLDSNTFLRVHKKHIVNLHEIHRVNRGVKSSIVLRNNEIIPLSRARKKEMLDKISR